MYPVIRRYDEQGLDNMSEESGEENTKNLIVKKSLRPVPSRDVVEQVKNMAASDPREVTQDTPKDPSERGG